MSLDRHLEALRETSGEVEDGELVIATRLRVRRTLERGHGLRRHAGILAALVVMLVATASWALATGKLQRLWRTPVAEAPVVALPTPAPPLRLEAPAPVQTPIEAPLVATPEQPKPKYIAPLAVAVSPLYRKAHELYFHGSDYVLALGAWDDYLAKEPKGQFVVEARYNRALCLIHLSRFKEAADALQPFATGDVLPTGYRQDEAKQLETKLQARLNGSHGCGNDPACE